MHSHVDVPVTSLVASTYVIPTDTPEGDGTLSWNSTTMVLVEARADDQLGIGWTYAPRAAATVVADTLTDLVVGRDARDVTAIFEDACRAVRNQGRGGIAGCAISAVDLALWDLLARLHGEPLHRFLGQVERDVPVYGSGGFTTYDDRRLDEQLSHWVDVEDLSMVKIKIGESWGRNVPRDLARIAQTRTRIGPERELFVDANGAYGAAQAVRVFRECEEAAVSWFEEPVSSDDLEGLRFVRRSVTADVAAGEYGWDVWNLRRLCSSGAVDCLQADATRCGGITGWRRAATVAAAHGLDISGHTSPHAHVHVAAATVNLRHLEWFHDHVRIEHLFFDGCLSPDGGAVTPADDRVGNGYTFRSTDAARYLVS